VSHKPAGPPPRVTEASVPIQVAADRLRIGRPLFYGVLLAYGIRPVLGISPAGKSAKLLTEAQFTDVARRLRAAGYEV
jgi:ADP-heptose:LPS heptosyltransferase